MEFLDGGLNPILSLSWWGLWAATATPGGGRSECVSDLVTHKQDAKLTT